MDMTLAEAIIVADHISRYGYPNKWDKELLARAQTKIAESREAVIARYRAEKMADAS